MRTLNARALGSRRLNKRRMNCSRELHTPEGEGKCGVLWLFASGSLEPASPARARHPNTPPTMEVRLLGAATVELLVIISFFSYFHSKPSPHQRGRPGNSAVCGGVLPAKPSTDLHVRRRLQDDGVRPPVMDNEDHADRRALFAH